MKILGRQRECVDFDRVLEHHHNAIASKSTGFHVAWKLKFNYVLLLQIIMNQNWSEREESREISWCFLQIIAQDSKVPLFDG